MHAKALQNVVVHRLPSHAEIWAQQLHPYNIRTLHVCCQSERHPSSPLPWRPASYPGFVVICLRAQDMLSETLLSGL